MRRFLAWKRPYALLEIGLFLSLMLVADTLWGAGDRFFLVEPHPFWVIVLVMAVQYGTVEALVATAASAAVLLVGNMPAQGFDQTIHDHLLRIWLRPLSWIVASVVLGELRARHHQRLAEALDRLGDAGRQIAILSRDHADLAAARDRLEMRLAGQLRTAAGVLAAARELETLDPREVLAGATDLLRAALDARAFSLFLLRGDVLTLVAADGWSESLPRSEQYEATSPLFQAVVGAQRHVSVATSEGERLLEGQGIMAGPLVDPSSGTLFGMLKVDEMRFLDFNLSSVQTFEAVCEWIAAAYGNAVAHQGSQLEDQTTRLLGMKHLDRQVDYLTAVARRFDFDLTLLQFQVQTDALPEGSRRQIPALLGDAAREVLRGTDLVFSHQPPGTQFAVVLPGATAETAVGVSRKLVRALHDLCGFNVPCTMQVRSICVAGEGLSHRARPDEAGAHQVA